MHYSVRTDVNIKEIVSSVLDLVKTKCCQFAELTGIDDIEKNLLNGIENDSAENVAFQKRERVSVSLQHHTRV